MIWYVILFFIIFLLSFKIAQKKYNIYDLLTMTILILFSGLRYEVGTDYSLYKTIYQSNVNGFLDSATSRTGYGFSMLTHFFGHDLGLNYNFFIFFCSFITITCIYIFIKKYSKKPGLAILLYVSLGFYTAAFNGFRQQLSLAIALFGYMLFKENKKLFSIIFFSIAFLLHSSSIVPIIIFVLFEIFKKEDINSLYIYIPIMIFYIFYNTLFFKLLGIVESYSLYVDYVSTPGLGTYMMVLVYNIVLIFFVLPKRKKIFSNNSTMKVFINYVIIGSALMILQTKNWLFVRLATDFTIFAPLLLAEYYVAANFKEKKLESLLFYAFIFIYYLLYINSFGGIIPYKWIF